MTWSPTDSDWPSDSDETIPLPQHKQRLRQRHGDNQTPRDRPSRPAIRLVPISKTTMAATNETDPNWEFYCRQWKEGAHHRVGKATVLTHAKPKKLEKLKSYKEQFFCSDWKRIEWFDAPGLKRPRGGIDYKFIQDVVTPSAAKVPSEALFSFDIVHLEDKKKKPKTLRQTIIVIEEGARRDALKFYRDVRETWLKHPFTVRDKGVTCPGKPPVEPHVLAKPDTSPAPIEIEGSFSREAPTLVTDFVVPPGGGLIVAAEEEHGIQMWTGSNASYTMQYAEAGAGSVGALDHALYVDEHVVGVGYASGRIQVFRMESASLTPFLSFEMGDLSDGVTITHLRMSSSPHILFAAAGNKLGCFSIDSGEQVAIVETPSVITALDVAPSSSGGTIAVVGMSGAGGAAASVLLYDSATMANGSPSLAMAGHTDVSIHDSVVYSARNAMVFSVAADGKVLGWSMDSAAPAAEASPAGGAALKWLAVASEASVAAVVTADGSAMHLLRTPTLETIASFELANLPATAPQFVKGSTLVYSDGSKVLITDASHSLPFAMIETEAPVAKVIYVPATAQLTILGADGFVRLVTKLQMRVEASHGSGALARENAKNIEKLEVYQAELAEYTAKVQAFEQATAAGNP
ncbi:uncharacterized protein AMSG_01351 [Thecamonas trahens ATCC 50062]|uniref:Uncharacterized protein n=1 Tax=Thecamonas trahens ATCC 50062 TaxID=461836 RepID=A0A0L0DNR5_THETB|nr:hypothetical protein AMSG_01351 [Thecamonas trahens ATCC 50062]KNC53641.1 hypothetical protein AMSG_01351 [Thecamonas trahens ATCC 50062]|eukprot:XP_013761958.1 hypothetical protein AMSG_01351 [Thecamonas trahens ATCC 50062]